MTNKQKMILLHSTKKCTNSIARTIMNHRLPRYIGRVVSGAMTILTHFIVALVLLLKNIIRKVKLHQRDWRLSWSKKKKVSTKTVKAPLYLRASRTDCIRGYS